MEKLKEQNLILLPKRAPLLVNLPWIGQQGGFRGILFSTAHLWLLFLLIAGAVFSAGVGALHIAPAQVAAILCDKLGWTLGIAYEEQQAAVLLAIRLPRVLLGMGVGAALGISGASIQGLFRNPLADPGLIGISSGASLFAVLAIVIQSSMIGMLGQWLNFYVLPFVAFFGAAATTLLVFRLSQWQGQVLVARMLLVGVAINALIGATIGLLMYLSTDAQLRNITFWNLGSLGGATWQTLWIMLPLVLISAFGLMRQAKSLNLLNLGESQAENLGVNLKTLRWQIVCFATLAVGASVALTGVIGFVGLVVPHMIRMIGGTDHRKLLLAAALGGAFALNITDTLARTLVAPAELPVGVVTALLGAPLFLYLLLKSKNAFR
jgi:iron complex transport system permease protein